MKVGIHQPHYFPWMGYFDKMAKSDIFILLDRVQMEKGSYMYRNRIISNQGKVIYLTISGDKHGYLKREYRDIRSTNDGIWLKKHESDIFNAYKESPYFYEVWEQLEPLFNSQEDTICKYCVRSIYKIKDILKIPTTIIMQSDMDTDEQKRKNDLVLNLCEVIGANTYLSGNGAKKYI